MPQAVRAASHDARTAPYPSHRPSKALNGDNASDESQSLAEALDSYVLAADYQRLQELHSREVELNKRQGSLLQQQGDMMQRQQAAFDELQQQYRDLAKTQQPSMNTAAAAVPVRGSPSSPPPPAAKSGGSALSWPPVDASFILRPKATSQPASAPTTSSAARPAPVSTTSSAAQASPTTSSSAVKPASASDTATKPQPDAAPLAASRPSSGPSLNSVKFENADGLINESADPRLRSQIKEPVPKASAQSSIHPKPDSSTPLSRPSLPHVAESGKTAPSPQQTATPCRQAPALVTPVRPETVPKGNMTAPDSKNTLPKVDAYWGNRNTHLSAMRHYLSACEHFLNASRKQGYSERRAIEICAKKLSGDVVEEWNTYRSIYESRAYTWDSFSLFIERSCDPNGRKAREALRDYMDASQRKNENALDYLRRLRKSQNGLSTQQLRQSPVGGEVRLKLLNTLTSAYRTHLRRLEDSMRMRMESPSSREKLSDLDLAKALDDIDG